jgi:hypothetical protein
MNAKNVLSKIATLLFEDKATVLFTEAKSANGDILSSPTFDLNEDVEVVSEDGTKSPAPDGEYTISLKDASGNENIIRIDVKDGKIVERANEEEEKNEEAKGEELASETTEEAKSLPNTTDEDPRNTVGNDTDDGKDPLISLEGLHERMGKVEAALAAIKTHLESAAPMEGAPLVSSLEPTAGVSTMSAVDEDEEELPKLDGAPIDPLVTEANKNNYGKKSANYQSTVLSKMYR